MQFVYPTFLWALAFIAIPIIIHLFHFRRFKRVYFSNVRFLKEVKQESRSRSRLRNLLVLLSRILAISFLVFLFAQPFIPQNEEVKQGPAVVSIFIDNSFSMSSLSQDVPLLDKAKRRASEIVNAFRPEDRIQILTHDFEGRHQRLVGQEAAIDLIEEIEITPVVKPIVQVVERQEQLMAESQAENRSIYLISDFQESIVETAVELQDSATQLYLLPMQAVQQSNVSLDSVWFEAPLQVLGANNALIAQFTNRSDQPVENVRLSLTYGGQTKPEGSFTLAAEESILDTIRFQAQGTGWQEAQVSITDYPVQFDDTYFFTFFVPEAIRILVIYEDQPNPFLQSAFEGMGYFELVEANANNLNYTQFGRYQLIVLTDLAEVSSGLTSALKSYQGSGGNVLVFPSSNADLGSYQNMLATLGADPLRNYQAEVKQVGSINTDEFVFNDVYETLDRNLRLPSSQGSYRLNVNGSGRGEALLTFRDGTPYLLKYKPDRGHLYLSLAPLDPELNDLARNGEIFVPMLYKMSISGGLEPQLAYTIGTDALVEMDPEAVDQEPVYKIRGEEGEFIPEQRVIIGKSILRVYDRPRRSGFFEVYRSQDAIEKNIAFNYDRTESSLKYLSNSQLEDKFSGQSQVLEVADSAIITSQIAQQSRGILLWKWCLIGVLIFLLAEILLLRFLKA